MKLRHVMNRVARGWYGELQVWYDPAYRLPMSSIESRTGIEPRRADLALWYLLAERALARVAVNSPGPVDFGTIELVHSQDYLDTLDQQENLGRIMGVDPTDVPVDQVMRSVRLATGGTVEAAHFAVENNATTLNLAGGFHHAEPDKGGALCAINDIAIAIASLRHNGFDGTITVLDLDAHPPDGLAVCLQHDDRTAILSISGEDWGPMPNVDETVIRGADDDRYLSTLTAVLARMPKAELAFVIAGGDVVKGDELGKLNMTFAGARARDFAVIEALDGTPAVWLPGGGYHRQAWKVLAGTGLALAVRSEREIPARVKPMRTEFRRIAAEIDERELSGELVTEEELMEWLGVRSNNITRLLGYYSTEGIEYAFHKLGILPHLHRLGYDDFRIAFDAQDNGDRMRVFGSGGGSEHLLCEILLEKRSQSGRRVLYVHWLTLRNPLAAFSDERPQLPGQEVPGQGLAEEAGQALILMAKRLKLDGIAYRPAWFHTAYAGRYELRFADPKRQHRFEVLIASLIHIGLLELSVAITEGRVLLNGEPYTWEPDVMVYWLNPPEASDDTELAATELEFTLVEPDAPKTH